MSILLFEYFYFYKFFKNFPKQIFYEFYPHSQQIRKFIIFTKDSFTILDNDEYQFLYCNLLVFAFYYLCGYQKTGQKRLLDIYYNSWFN